MGLYRVALEECRKALLEKALAEAGSVTGASALLGITRKTFYSIARRLGVALPRRPRRTPEEIRAGNARRAREAYRANPEAARKRRERSYYGTGTMKEAIRRYRERKRAEDPDFFARKLREYRARKLAEDPGYFSPEAVARRKRSRAAA